MIHAAESTHWYDRAGKPAYTVTAKAGHQRPTTLADARKLDLLPSVTTIIKCAAAPGLEKWKADQLMMAALTLPRLSDELEKDWLARVVVDSKEQARKAAERGTAIHAACQGHYEGIPPQEDYLRHVQGAVAEVSNWAGSRNDWRPEFSFAHQLGFGGKTDLHCPVFLLDFKSKEFDETTDLKTWDEQCMQLAANREGQKIPGARCAIVYVSVTVPGLSKVLEVPEDDLTRGWEMFVYLLGFWKAKSKYRCGWEEKQAA